MEVVLRGDQVDGAGGNGRAVLPGQDLRVDRVLGGFQELLREGGLLGRTLQGVGVAGQAALQDLADHVHLGMVVKSHLGALWDEEKRYPESTVQV